jgi:hypothetical protein
MTRAPNVTYIGAILNNAAQMRTGRRKRSELTGWSAHQYSRAASVSEDLRGIRRDFVGSEW